MARVTNLVQNGRAKYTSGTVEVRRNMAAYGTGAIAPINNTFGITPRWAGQGGTATNTRLNGQLDGPHGSSSYVRKTWTSIGTSLSDVAFQSSNFGVNSYPVTVGDTWTFCISIRPSKTINPLEAMMVCVFYDSNGATVSTKTDSRDLSQCAANVWKEFYGTFTVPSGAAFCNVYINLAIDMNDGWAAGDTLDGGAFLAENSPVFMGYFDGSYSPDPDLTPSWTGTANASASVLTGVQVATISVIGVGNNSRNIKSTRWPNGGTSIRVIPTSSANDSGAFVGGDSGGMRLGMVAGRATAIRARGYIPAPQTGSLGTVNGVRQVTLWYHTNNTYTHVNGTQGPNVAGEFISELVTTLPAAATEAFVRLYNGASAGNGEVYWTDVIVAQADTEAEALAAVQTYFDGDSEPFRISSGNQLVIPKWSGTPGSSSSYYDWTKPYTLAAKWDDVGQRTYELGCDRGVFYPPDGDGVLWNGLTAVNFSTENGDSSSYYHDGVKYFTNFQVGEFKGHLEAFTYPDEFMLYDGFSSPVDGMYLDEQQRKPFGLTYRTRVGDDQYGDSSFYRIHILYNVYAVPSDKAYATIGESPTASTFSWDLKTLPIAPGISGSYYSNTSHIVVDTRKFELSKIKALEEILYGDGADPGRLPLPSEVYSILNS